MAEPALSLRQWQENESMLWTEAGAMREIDHIRIVEQHHRNVARIRRRERIMQAIIVAVVVLPWLISWLIS
jgi:hypothetical protein